MADQGLAATRYRLLLQQMRDEWTAARNGNERGFKADAARRLGVKPEYIGMIEKGDRTQAAPVKQAIATMGIDAAFFFEPLDHEPRYKDYLGTKVERTDAIEMAGVTAYFRRNPHHERFRAEVNRHLNASVGDVAPDLVKSIVRGLEDLESETAERH